ncbi:hypothetical protein [Streptomyces longwoodensis]|uniref:hypothetical protein n=1 Tax=Streptomyces longwoodensis TaxID=68231 RepID=UPI0037002BCF
MDDDPYVNPYFGEPWPSGICDTAPRTDTPVGELCGFCQLPFQDGDQGILTPAVLAGGQPGTVGWHKECILRQTVGSPFHQLGKCSCHGGTNFDAQTPAERRAEALAAWDLWHQRGTLSPGG